MKTIHCNQLITYEDNKRSIQDQRVLWKWTSALPPPNPHRLESHPHTINPQSHYKLPLSLDFIKFCNITVCLDFLGLKTAVTKLKMLVLARVLCVHITHDTTMSHPTNEHFKIMKKCILFTLHSYQQVCLHSHGSTMTYLHSCSSPIKPKPLPW